MALMEPVACVVDPDSGSMSERTGRYEKRFSDLAGLYGDAAAYRALSERIGDPVVYAVDDFRPSARAGDMIHGVTHMIPGRVGEEYFLTRGHIHAQADRPEIYYGQKGHGLMQMESPEGETRIVEIRPQTLCYVPPYWIHRSINVGSGDLVMVFAYPADSGQDYGIIETSGGMRHRVMVDGDGWRLAENPTYRPRSAETVAALMNKGA
ncbi:glucose-6-phosphate isomerase [Ensifer soli]|uniref:glucose-6-phosphate isomerase n=1 Tax=Ciceribacter sp. sgz301302 TaxID=3342379 RepID=UPI0035B7C45D